MGIETSGGRRCLGGLAIVLAMVSTGGGCAETEGSGQDRSILPAGAVVGVYDDTADADRLRFRLTALRARFGRGPALPFTVAQASLGYAKERIAKGANPENVLEFTLQGAADDGDRTVRFWCQGTKNLATFGFPTSLLSVNRLNVAISVIQHVGPGTPGYYVLLVTPSFHETPFGAR